MAVQKYSELLEHVGHEIEVATYGPSENVFNVAIECSTCGEVLMDYENPEFINYNE